MRIIGFKSCGKYTFSDIFLSALTSSSSSLAPPPQVKIKDRLILLHLPAEVRPDAAKVQRVQANGHLVLILPRANFDPRAARSGAMSKATAAGMWSNGRGYHCTNHSESLKDTSIFYTLGSSISGAF